MRPTTPWSENRIVRIAVLLAAKPFKCKHPAAPSRKLDVTKLKSNGIHLALQQKRASALSSDDTDQWPEFKATVFNTAAKVIGYRKMHHKDWFDEQDSEACSLLDHMHEKRLIWMNDKSNSAKKSACVQARSRLRQMKETWWSATAELLQLAEDRHYMKAFYDGLKAVYGPRDTGSIPTRSKDGKTLITDHAGILSRWAEHFHSVLNETTTFNPSVVSELQSYQPGIQTMSSCCLLTEMKFSGQSIRCPLVKYQDQTACHWNCSNREVQTLSTNWSHCISLSGAAGQSHKN